MAPGDLGTGFEDQILEYLTVFPALDGLERGADQFDVVFLQDSLLVQSHRSVQSGLSAEGGQNRVGFLFGNNRFQHRRGDRLDIRLVSKPGIGHDGGGVRIDQNHADSLFA